MTQEFDEKNVSPTHNRDPKTYAKLLEDYFDIVDTDRSGDISQHEIKEFLLDKNTQGQVRDSFTILHENFDAFRDLQYDRWDENKFDLKDIAKFKAATADSVADKYFYPKTIGASAFHFASLFASVGALGGALISGGPAAIAGAVGGAKWGMYTGTVLGSVDAWTTRSNRESIRSFNYFDLKESKGTAIPRYPFEKP